MAKFQEVMRQAKRMCGAFGEECGECPLYKIGKSCPLTTDCEYVVPMEWDLKNISEIERIVMDWAAANPEPRYPTWAEWLRMLGVERLSDIIPADIAEKLGIKPIGGVTDENA